LFNLFVAFEILLLSSYALMCLGASREQLRHAYKYVMLNLLGSTFFVLGAGLVYGLTGTLNFADLAAFVADANARGESLPPGFQAVSMVLLFVFALKAAVFPLWFWLPDTYHTCPIAICALFGGLLTKVGVYALFRIFPMAFAAPGLTDSGGFITIVSFAAGFSLIIAILGAIAMRSIRRLLALTLMSHIGYFAFGLALMTPDAMTGAIFYMVQHMVVMAALFLCCGAIEMYAGTDDLQKMGGLLNRAPWLAVLFFIAAVSLIGLPPTSGFYGKVLLLAEGFRAADRGFWILSLLGVITSILTLVAMGKVWTQAFWSPERVEAAPDHTWLTPAPRNLAPVYAGAVLLVIISITAAFAAEPLTRVSRLAADSLTQPRGYVAAVLGESAWPGALATEAPPEAQTTAVDVDQHHKGSAH
ncbi:MAG: proton-conducting transporter membrane subunit, partial [Planctomycetota bacterium]|nr:proton-conducting transporter membrane subunit [Planctomycetota bacterium]